MYYFRFFIPYFIASVFIQTTASFSMTDFVTESSNDITEQLCNSSDKTVYMTLNSTKRYTITPQLTGSLCIVENATISITSDSYTVNSNVLCTQQLPHPPGPTLGIVFINSTLTINRVVMKYCGTYLHTLPMSIKSLFNYTSASLYYPDSFASALLFIECKVTMNNFIAMSSFGFAMIGINLDRSVISNVSFVSHISLQSKYRTIGNGILIHYLDNPGFVDPVANSKHLVIRDSQFKWNLMAAAPQCFPLGSGIARAGCDCLSETFANDSKIQRKPVVASGILTVMYNNEKYSANVNLINLLFSNNRARLVPLPTSLLILHYRANEFDKTNILNSKFKTLGISNDASCPDSGEFGFYFYPSKNTSRPVVYRPLHISDTVFRSQPHELNVIRQPSLKSILYIGIPKQMPQAKISITFSKVIIRTSNAAGQGTGLNVNTSLPMTLVLTSVSVYENKVLLMQVNKDIGIILLRGPVNCIVNGTKQNPSFFTDNNGIVIYSSSSTRLFLQGYVIFKSNIGSNGAAINLQGKSLLYFMKNSTVLFEENRSVGLGGAIYAVTAKSQNSCSILIPNYVPNSLNVTFKGNFAVQGGNDIYAHPIFNCIYDNILKKESDQFTLNQIFSFETTSSHNDVVHSISTVPVKFFILYSSSITVFPGQKYYSCISAKDVLNRSVFATVETKILPERLNNRELNKDWLSMDVNTGPEQTIQENQPCSNVSVMFHSTTDYGSIIFNNISRGILYYMKQISQHRVVTVKLSGCPVGFVLDEHTGSCKCSHALKRVNMVCSIQDQTFSRLSQSPVWTGFIGFKKSSDRIFAISFNCPIGHCRNTFSQHKWFYSFNQTIYLRENANSFHNMSICANGRSHALCSKCSEGLTEAFGTVKCVNCNQYTYFWLNIMLVLLFGPLFILFLYTFRLTLAAGTMNGIIFYANFLNTGLIDYLYNSFDSNMESLFKDIALGFLMFTNFRYGFTVCFFRSMTVYFKAAFALVFPYYLLILVGVIVLVSRWSSWVSKHTSHSSVQVLVTVVHFSFSSVFIQLVTILSWTTMYTDDNEYKVWIYDGSASFLSDPRHVHLVIVSFMGIFPLLFTYIFFLIFTKPSMKCSSRCNIYFRPLYEAIHAPYKEGKEYWFAMKLLLLIFTSIIWPFKTPDNSTVVCIVIASLLCAFLTAQGLFQPFKSRAIGLLNNWTLFNLLIIYVSLLLPQDEIEKTTVIIIVSTMLIILTFIGVVFYHSILAFQLNSKCCMFLTILKLHDGSFRHRSQVTASTANRNDVSNGGRFNQGQHQPLVNTVHGDADDSNEFYDSCNGYREPLIAD